MWSTQQSKFAQATAHTRTDTHKHTHTVQCSTHAYNSTGHVASPQVSTPACMGAPNPWGDLQKIFPETNCLGVPATSKTLQPCMVQELLTGTVTLVQRFDSTTITTSGRQHCFSQVGQKGTLVLPSFPACLQGQRCPWHQIM